ncbi:MAG: DUF1097 domain-containing protein [Lachnospiraceae bacterium]|nr:DUF1097 domain-containing protein [Lachnospiraceae bacterium]
MTVRGKINWSIWIGVWTGIYVLLYMLSPLGQYGFIWITFIALPIFFNGGAARKDYFSQMISSCIGVVWGLIMLAGASALSITGAAGSNALSCGIFTVTCCLMMIFKDNTKINKVPAMFGGISACFSQGGEHIVGVMITLCLGVSLGLLCNEGMNFIAEDGRWRWSVKKTTEIPETDF